MILIEYTLDSVESEPGPNLYWRGEPADFLRLVCDLHPLGVESGVSFCISDLEYIEMEGEWSIIALSSIDGQKLVSVDRHQITIDLGPALWSEVLVFMLSISYYKSHNYVEFDSLNLTEDANFIIASI